MQYSDGGGYGFDGPTVLSVSVILFVLGKMAWDKFLSREGRGAAELVTQLSDRITQQENRLVAVETLLGTERDMRLAAERQVSDLSLRVWRLENELRKHNIEVPT